MAAAEPFLFEVSFDEEDLARAEAEAAEELAARQAELAQPEEDMPTFTEEQVDAARQEGYEAGRDAGVKETADAIEAKINDALGVIGNQFGDLFKRQALDTASTFTNAANIAVAIARKCFPYLNDTHGFPEIERMVREVLTEVLEEPRVIIHINPDLKEALDDRVATLAKESNFEGQIIVLEADDIAPGDCRITWSSGTAERDVPGTLDKIDQIVQANLGSAKEEMAEEISKNGAHADPPPSSESAPEAAETPPDMAAETEPGPTASEAAQADAGEDAAMPGEAGTAAEPAADIAADAESATGDSPADAPDGADTAESPPGAPADAPAGPAQEVPKANPEDAPPPPSAELMDQAAGPADFLASEALDGDEALADQSSEDDAMNAAPPILEDEREALTAAHLQMGPGNVEQESNEAILEPAPGPPDADEDRALDEDPDSAPPRGPNR